MIYLEVAHTNDEDCDTFSFPDLQSAVEYITHNKKSEWVMSDIAFEEFPLNDYTHIPNSNE